MNMKQITDGMSDADLFDWCRKHYRGIHVATPVFDGAEEEKIRAMLVEAGVEEAGQSQLYDGLTGDPFANQSNRWCYVYVETASSCR